MGKVTALRPWEEGVWVAEGVSRWLRGEGASLA